MSDTAYVTVLPDCDIHKHDLKTQVPAAYDGSTRSGRWAYMCQSCFIDNGVGLGTGRGQRLVVGEKPKTKSSDVMAAIEDGDFDLVEDLVGDGDILDFI